MFKVEYEFLNDFGEWMKDDWSNNGEGMSLEEALLTARHMELQEAVEARNIRIVPM